MATLAKLMVELGLTDNFSGGLAAVGGKLTSIGKTLTTAITLPALAVGVASVKMASDLNESMSKVDVVFGNSATKVQQWSTTTATSIGVSRNEALTAAGTFGNLLNNMGFTTDASADMSIAIVQLAADLGSFNNVPTDVALEAIRSGLVGETEPLRQFGVNLSQAAIEAEAMRLGLFNGTGELTNNARAQATLSLIMQQTTAAQGDFARTSEGAANQTKILRAQLADTGATLGTQLLPALIIVLEKLNGLIASYDGLSPRQQKIIEGLAVLAAVIGPIAIALGFIITNATAFGAALGTVIAPLTAVGGLFVLLLPVIAPVTAALGVLKLAGVDLGAMLTSLTGTVRSVASAIAGTFQSMLQTATSIFAAIKRVITGDISETATSALTSIGDMAAAISAWLDVIETYFSDAFENVKTTVGTKVGELYANVTGLVSSLAETIYTNALSVGSNLGQGVIDGIDGIWDSVVSEAEGLASAAYHGILKKLHIESPSKDGIWAGEMLGIGLAQGIAKTQTDVFAAANGLSARALIGIAPVSAAPASGGTTHSYGGITINVNGSSDPKATANEVFRLFSRELALQRGA